MTKITNTKIAIGIYYVEIPQADLRLICGCPPETIKLLMRSGFVKKEVKKGVEFESGPNAILLSDRVIQNGQLSNALEFVALQMFYRQGMFIPGHPNNTGKKVALIGVEEQIKNQAQYFMHGTIGLGTEEELIATGVSQELAKEIIQLKYKFFFGQIPTIETYRSFVDAFILEEDAQQVVPDVYIKRTAPNQFEIHYQDESTTVDLNIPDNYQYPLSYNLEPKKVIGSFFSIIHSGDGDGWDPTRSSMSSIISYKEKFYLIDMPPNLDKCLLALGIDINEIAGVFHTHVHDDHFAGIVSFLENIDHSIDYYATAMVKETAARKYSALLGVDKAKFDDHFVHHDLTLEQWNDVDGLTVKPLYSPHPVDTTIFYFKVAYKGKEYSYAHLADIISLSKLKAMISSGKTKGISQAFYDKIKRDYLIPVNLKKIDIDGGMIHGDAEDFRDDKSDKLALSHTDHDLTDKQKEIGVASPFGSVDVLIS